MANPEQQGLKLLLQLYLRSQRIALMANPEQQGLKRQWKVDADLTPAALMANPEQQGLKRFHERQMRQNRAGLNG